MEEKAVEHEDLDVVLRVLRDEGYTVVGPTVRGGAVVLAELGGADELPVGWGVETGPGRYRLVERTDGAAFAHSAGPLSWKSFLHPAREPIGTWDESGMVFRAEVGPAPRYAFLGVRPCDLAAMKVLDGVLALGAHPDPGYTARRDGVFVIAVNCTEPGGTCFCVSMGGGPRAGAGYDLALTERLDATGHRYVVEVGTEAGRRVLDRVPNRSASTAEVDAADADLADAAGRMGRAMPDVDLRRLLADSRESPHWDDVASRCLSCANCTMVCPTCFCTTTEDVTDLTGDHAERMSRWDSCFNPDFSYLHGGAVRSGTAGRYRQWISHKLSTWHDQFGMSGCVGCGRCVTWCPAGIDITAEAAKLAELLPEEAGGHD
ncbi:4Fe-4S dicluster domain-containing protein [Actinophytocola oryzae]|uniref:4Fe-4S dicluster protein n=1 Tax=Actinophytocola oryzae TaxID=502181 RepID=A0A4V3FRM3_9PSEU|nr:4Fe-4S dicluster domain-containing protein [Actinophytocola oryzae]TDV44131.1 4Fe-4S dicluster protein [Actinophytocola oryzae]